jgi:hypothetical protein
MTKKIGFNHPAEKKKINFIFTTTRTASEKGRFLFGLMQALVTY